MEYFKIFLSSFFSIALLFISAKIIGNKQISQLNMFDYINGITIGSVAADMAIHLDNNVFYPVIAIVVYTLVIAAINKLSAKNMKMRRFFTGKSIVLMDKGKIFYNNLKTAKIDLNEFLTQCRIAGFFNIEDIETALLEQNGRMSFLPRSVSRPVTPKDMSLTPQIERPFFCLVSDGKILRENVAQAGLSIDELMDLIRLENIPVTDIYAALYDGNKLSLYPRITYESSNDITQ